MEAQDDVLRGLTLGVVLHPLLQRTLCTGWAAAAVVFEHHKTDASRQAHALLVPVACLGLYIHLRAFPRLERHLLAFFAGHLLVVWPNAAIYLFLGHLPIYLVAQRVPLRPSWGLAITGAACVAHEWARASYGEPPLRLSEAICMLIISPLTSLMMTLNILVTT